MHHGLAQWKGGWIREEDGSGYLRELEASLLLPDARRVLNHEEVEIGVWEAIFVSITIPVKKGVSIGTIAHLLVLRGLGILHHLLAESVERVSILDGVARQQSWVSVGHINCQLFWSWYRFDSWPKLLIEEEHRLTKLLVVGPLLSMGSFVIPFEEVDQGMLGRGRDLRLTDHLGPELAIAPYLLLEGTVRLGDQLL